MVGLLRLPELHEIGGEPTNTDTGLAAQLAQPTTSCVTCGPWIAGSNIHTLQRRGDRTVECYKPLS